MGSMLVDWLALITGIVSAQPPLLGPLVLVVPVADADDITYNSEEVYM